MIFGHSATVRELESRLPPVALLFGPESIGKRTLAEHLAIWHNAGPGILRIHSLTMDAARDVRAFSMRAPFRGIKLVIISLDGAGEGAVNSLLKELEEPPFYMRYILIASNQVLLTVVSRSVVFRMGLLTDYQVRCVLESLGMSPDLAASAAPSGYGQVASALATSDAGPARTITLGALRGVLSGNRTQLVTALSSWDDRSHTLLRTWAMEAASGRWRMFTPEEVPVKDYTFPRRLLGALARVDSRSRLAARVVLESFLADR